MRRETKEYITLTTIDYVSSINSYFLCLDLKISAMIIVKGIIRSNNFHNNRYFFKFS